MRTPLESIEFHLADKASPTIVLAGATGDLGIRIASCLLERGATVKALVREQSADHVVSLLSKKGAIIEEVDFTSEAELIKVCAGAACVVSALSGLRDVIVEGQTTLLNAAVQAGVPRFIPSDFSIDFTKLPYGSNRNLDLRREFGERLDKAPIAATSILNGMFTELLTGEAPVVLFDWKRIVYWGDADQLLDFTTIDNTAAFTAAAALDPSTPRYLRIAGDVMNVLGLQNAASQATGNTFKLFRVGSLGAFGFLTKFTKAVMPSSDEVFPPWQGMQYLHNMFSGLPKLNPLDNSRYPDITWTPVPKVLASRKSK